MLVVSQTFPFFCDINFECYICLTISVNFITVIKRDLVLLPSFIRSNSPELKKWSQLDKTLNINIARSLHDKDKNSVLILHQSEIAMFM